jgi:thiamine-monophosphate kinase
MVHGLTGTLGDVGEFGLIEALTARFAQGADVQLGPGDDAAVLTVAGGAVVTSLDLLVQNRHFRLDWSSALDIGHKAAAESFSDINAMGGRATGLVVGLAAPSDLDAAWALDFAQGVAEEAHLVGASVLGGDLSRGDAITIAVTALGVCEHGVVRRSGAQPGDQVALAGRQGWAAAGFAVLGRGFRSPRIVVEAHRRPQPPYDVGPRAAEMGATAMIDISDGLLQDLGHIARASGVAIDVATERITIPEQLHAVGTALGQDPLGFILGGGDDYGLLATYPSGTELPDDWTVIGTVLDAGEAGAVTVDGGSYVGPGGHQHFS